MSKSKKSDAGQAVLDKAIAGREAVIERKAGKVRKAKAAKSAKAKKADKTKSATRIGSAAQTVASLKKPTSTEDLITAADADYAAQGGKSNPKESAWACRVVLATMEALGLVKAADGTISVVGKVVAR